MTRWSQVTGKNLIWTRRCISAKAAYVQQYFGFHKLKLLLAYDQIPVCVKNTNIGTGNKIDSLLLFGQSTDRGAADYSAKSYI